MKTLAPKMEVGSVRQLYQAAWAPAYEATLRILNDVNNAHTLLPFGDEYYGAPNAATFTGARYHATGLAPTWTWAVDTSWAAFDNHLAAATADFPYRYQGIVPFVEFNGTDERATSPDAVFWTPISAGVDVAFNIGAWVLFDVVNVEQLIMGKWHETGNQREWVFEVTSAGKVNVIFADESAAKYPSAATTAAITAGVWHHIVLTYDGTGGASAMNGVTIYVDGTSVAVTATNDALYVAMEDHTALATLAHYQTSNQFHLNGKIAGGPCGPWLVKGAAMTAAQVNNLYQIGRRLLAL